MYDLIVKALITFDLFSNSSQYWVIFLSMLLTATFIIFICIISFFITKRVLFHIFILPVRRYYNRIIHKKSGKLLFPTLIVNILNYRFTVYISYFIPLILVIVFSSLWPVIHNFLYKFTVICIILNIVIILNLVSKSISSVYSKYSASRRKPIKGYLQLGNIFIYIVAFIFSLSIVLGTSLSSIFATIGAFAAVVFVVFKDFILGIFASFQLVYNKVIKIGDWVEIPEYHANGEIIDISINVLKVKNWDKSIVIIPLYKLIIEPFKNWSAMVDSGFRRITKTFYIDVQSIKFCNITDLDKYSKIDIISKQINNYIQDYHNFYSKENENSNINSLESQFIKYDANNYITNSYIYRMYVLQYLKNNINITSNMVIMARYTEHTPNGLKLEIYAFSNENRLALFEKLQSEIVEHLSTSLGLFELKLFQLNKGVVHKN